MTNNVNIKKIYDTVYRLAADANLYLRKDFKKALNQALLKEKKAVSKNMLKTVIENYKIAEKKSFPICQDTGMVIVFFEIGKDVSPDFPGFENAVNNAVAKAYKDYYFRKSVVNSPLTRKNTGDNTPCIIHYDFTKRKGIKISVLVKGFGAENKSAVKMMNPTDSKEEIADFITDTVKKAGPDACPPYVIGVGIGGTMDKAALLSKKALLYDINKKYKNPDLEKFRKLVIKKINNLKIGPMGLGGEFTCLGVNILTFPTHIAGLPVAVNVNCHALRSADAVIK
jgi:fumarate hydratase subunit alpha